MDSNATADGIREVSRHPSDLGDRPRQNVYGDSGSQADDELSARPVQPIEDPVAPVGGPEYTGRA